MKLRAYLSIKGISTADFAKELGVSPVAIGRYLTRKRKPQWFVMERIYNLTEGAVTPNDFIAEWGQRDE